MRFNRALPVLALAVARRLRDASDEYPSLAIRDAERVSGTLEPVAPRRTFPRRRPPRCSTGSTSSPPSAPARTRRSSPKPRRRAAPSLRPAARSRAAIVGAGRKSRSPARGLAQQGDDRARRPRPADGRRGGRRRRARPHRRGARHGDAQVDEQNATIEALARNLR
jgi:hypothetical protein